MNHLLEGRVADIIREPGAQINRPVDLQRARILTSEFPECIRMNIQSIRANTAGVAKM